MKMIKSAVMGTLMVPAFVLAAGTASAEENTATATTTAEATYLTTAPEGTFYAGSLTGNDVQSSVEDDDNIGTINDLIINEDGQIQAVVIGVGGFLGMGEKDVAIEWDSLELTHNQDNNDYEIRVNASRDALEEADEFDRDENNDMNTTNDTNTTNNTNTNN
ncbi:PRC-barrel domain-containing protein [Vreelandella nanhaiensis]|uniref:PRC-barrel domain containing protein n=1 Tax=Vreelandella nanhaiensis TaxID=1258546 RepID=A0A433KX36_9GAMM|nr:PRC-barrel domain-containing protein [Halomonas nanhaiensis]RUR34167.1 PRC-barrel domain containing protein [Halomonas nanhaiensis]